MGASLSWIAVRGKSKAAIAQRLGVIASDSYLPTAYPAILTATTDKGWHIFRLNTGETPLIEDTFLLPLSDNGGEVVMCVLDDRVMYSLASGFYDGQEIWTVAHDGCDGSVYDLSVDGVLPEAFESIKAEAQKKQDDEGGEAADVDYFYSVPMKLALACTDYHHYEDDHINYEAVYYLVAPQDTA